MDLARHCVFPAPAEEGSPPPLSEKDRAAEHVQAEHGDLAAVGKVLPNWQSSHSYGLSLRDSREDLRPVLAHGLPSLRLRQLTIGGKGALIEGAGRSKGVEKGRWRVKRGLCAGPEKRQCLRNGAPPGGCRQVCQHPPAAATPRAGEDIQRESTAQKPRPSQSRHALRRRLHRRSQGRALLLQPRLRPRSRERGAPGRHPDSLQASTTLTQGAHASPSAPADDGTG